jgi:hypothetical protein
MASGVRTYGLLSVRPLVTTRKMVESRLATPRPDHDWSNRVGAPRHQGGVRSLRGKRLLLLHSRYLTPEVSNVAGGVPTLRWPVKRSPARWSLGYSGGTVPAFHRLPFRLWITQGLTAEAPCLLRRLYHPRLHRSNAAAAS